MWVRIRHCLDFPRLLSFVLLIKSNVKTKMDMEHRWNDIDGAKQNNFEKKLSKCCFVQLKLHMDWGMERVTVYFEPIFSNIRNSTAFWIILRHRPFVLLVRGTCTWRRGRSTGGMILTEDNRITWIKTRPSVAFYIKRFTGTGPRSKPGLRGDRADTDHLSRGPPCEVWNKLAKIWKTDHVRVT